MCAATATDHLYPAILDDDNDSAVAVADAPTSTIESGFSSRHNRGSFDRSTTSFNRTASRNRVPLPRPSEQRTAATEEWRQVEQLVNHFQQDQPLAPTVAERKRARKFHRPFQLTRQAIIVSSLVVCQFLAVLWLEGINLSTSRDAAALDQKIQDARKDIEDTQAEIAALDASAHFAEWAGQRGWVLAGQDKFDDITSTDPLPRSAERTADPATSDTSHPAAAHTPNSSHGEKPQGETDAVARNDESRTGETTARAENADLSGTESGISPRVDDEGTAASVSDRDMESSESSGRSANHESSETVSDGEVD